ncbi:MAG: calcium-binding protein [Pseudomonadota bacterium]
MQVTIDWGPSAIAQNIATPETIDEAFDDIFSNMQLVSTSATQVVFSSGTRSAVINGTGFVFSLAGPTAGTVTSVLYFDDITQTDLLLTITTTVPVVEVWQVGQAEAGGQIDAIENYFTSFDWIYNGTSNTESFPEGTTSSDGVVLNLQGDDVVNLVAGNDEFFTGDGNDSVNGGGGKDTLEGGNGEDTVIGGGGNDLLRGGADDDDMIGGTGNDRMLGGGGNDTLRGSDGADKLFGGNGNDVLNGGGQGDELDGGEGNDRLNGGAGKDYLASGEGNDRLIGGGNDDTLFGCGGDDFLKGGAGSDTFIYDTNSGNDTIADFVVGEDILDIKDVPDEDITIEDVDDGALISWTGNSVLLIGLTAEDLL